MRALFLCLAATALAGCSSLIRQGGDSFEASGVAVEQFEGATAAFGPMAISTMTYEGWTEGCSSASTRQGS